MCIRDRHGTVHGEIVKSPVIYIGESRTWQQGMMGFADIYNEYNTRLLWHGPIPFGWNSWYAYIDVYKRQVIYA